MSVPPGLTLQNWQTVPHLHWAFQHLADFLPTARISRGDGPVAEMPARSAALSEIVLPGGTTTVGDVMGATATDGWIVTRHGAVLEERYPAGMLPDTPHLLMSVSKTLVATVAGALIGEGALAPDALLSTYVPALAECGYAGATVRDLLDMRSGIAFSEDYLDPLAEVRLLEQAIGWAPRTVPDLPDTMYGFLLTLRRKGPHGGPFDYRSCETDVLGWVCEAAGGTRMPALMSDVLWSRLGAQADAVIGVDREGTGMFDGGINACLRDLVRVGTLFLTEGVSLSGRQVVAPSWIADTFTGAADSRDAFAAGRDTARFPGGMYRNKCWLPYPGDDVLLCLGIHGQMIYVNRRAGMVAAKLSSWALPEENDKLKATIAAFDAIAAEFR
ncbi:hydrolase [Mycobacterium sp. IS-1742]|uniref:serine hydrolase domain-containing protein n=1 Tax=Mycobacterium sp. IS-1742 TaxID=1772285 RepID=UPI0007401A04|nr:serine hydrolase [Mycobacterium sp. IS-1742]KUI32206.1 hydrolase [Mycobacterium sp. IS-1742]